MAMEEKITIGYLIDTITSERGEGPRNSFWPFWTASTGAASNPS